VVVDSFTEGVIRRCILNGYQNKEYMTVRKIHTILKQDPNFPSMGYVTLWKVMKKQLKFKMRKFHNKPVPFERDDISAARHKYLRQIKKYRESGYNVCYSSVLLPKSIYVSKLKS